MPLPNAPDGVSRRRLLKAAAAGAVSLALPPAQAALPKGPHTPGEAFSPIPADRVKPVVPDRVLPFDLADVRLLPGPFKHAQDLDGAYLLFLVPDRTAAQLSASMPGCRHALTSTVAGRARAFAGHIGGHYLSACALAYRATGDARFRQKVDYVVGDLAECQRRSPDGLVTAIPDAKTIFGKVAADGTMTGWVPVVHPAQALRGSARRLSSVWESAGAGRAGPAGGLGHRPDSEPHRHPVPEYAGNGNTAAWPRSWPTSTPSRRTLSTWLWPAGFTHRAVFDPLAVRQESARRPAFQHADPQDDRL